MSQQKVHGATPQQPKQEQKKSLEPVHRLYETSHFKPFEAPKRRGGLAENQVSISKHSITLPLVAANALGQQVALLYSDIDHAIAVQKSANGGYKVKPFGKNKSSRNIYAKTFIEAKKVKTGRYTTQFDDKTQMLIVSVEVTK